MTEEEHRKVLEDLQEEKRRGRESLYLQRKGKKERRDITSKRESFPLRIRSVMTDI